MTTTTTDSQATVRIGPRASVAAALDVMLTDAALEEGTPRRFLAPGSAAKAAAGLARRPRRVVSRAGGLGAKLARVAAGSSELSPGKGDRRFADRGWRENWLLNRLMQGYLAVGGTVDALISDAELDWRTERQARFAAGNVLDALAPTNFPWSNPAVIREIVDTGGVNLVKGARRFARDVSRPPRLPATVDTTKFDVGRNLAVTPGAVVMRTDVAELIQYRPQTERVRELPLLFVPPTINKYYVLDLAPDRSMIGYLVAQGFQVFTISWRNPDAGQAHFDLDTYAEAVLEARAAVAETSDRESVHIAAACSGGIITAGALNHLLRAGQPEAASLTLMVCALDNARAGDTSALVTRELAAAAVAESARRGYLDGRALAGVFAWLRPNDLIWGYVINNYLLGKEPPAFDVLYWNQDSVRLAAGLHRDFIRIALENSLTKPGHVAVLGDPVDLAALELDSYVVAGSNDHIVPWQNAYRSTQLLGGESRFVLSTSGHIQALINPPGPQSRSSYRIAEDNPSDAEAWLGRAAVRPGSWWPDYVAWLGERSGELGPAPKRLGCRAHKAVAKAPGTYVYAA
jgi:polyhydroxyalkanoate synthase